MTSTRRIPRRFLPDPDEQPCSACGREGRPNYEHGIVTHRWTQVPCVVRAVPVQTERKVAA